MALGCLLLKKAATQIGTYRLDSSASFTGLPQIPEQLANPTQARVDAARIARVSLKNLFAARFLLQQNIGPDSFLVPSTDPRHSVPG